MNVTYSIEYTLGSIHRQPTPGLFNKASSKSFDQSRSARSLLQKQLSKQCFTKEFSKFASTFLPPANEVWGKVIFSVACVKNSVHRWGLSQCMLGYPPPTRPPWEQTPRDQAPPPGPGTPPPGPGTPSPQTRHPPCTVHAGRYDQQVGGMHPTGMQSCLYRFLLVF